MSRYGSNVVNNYYNYVVIVIGCFQGQLRDTSFSSISRKNRCDLKYRLQFTLVYDIIILLVRVWTPVKDLTSSKVGSTVLIRARLHNNRGTGKKYSVLW